MDRTLLLVFQQQVKLQCEAVLVAGDQMQDALNRDVDHRFPRTSHLWVAIQSLLGAAGNISKALWGASGKRAKERAALRASIEVDDSSPFHEVDMRNHLEHFDERLDRWWETSESRNLIDIGIVPPGVIRGTSDSDMFRILDPTSGEVVFVGERFNLNRLIEEAERLLPLVTAAMGSKE